LDAPLVSIKLKIESHIACGFPECDINSQH